MITNPLKTGPWKLTDLAGVKPNGCKVLSTFACGGGSTMGYKLAGFEVLGAVELDPQMAEIYIANHKPKYMYRMAVQEFNKIPDADLPEEFFELDILDGSPPCSSFSMAGAREKKWGASSKFREGQAKQHLDDLFFHFIQTADKLQPRVVVAENVKGLILGNAKSYVKEIFKGFRDIGYSAQLFLLNSSKMGVPQRRERTFFIATRDNKRINLNFDEQEISVLEATNDLTTRGAKLSPAFKKWWEPCKPGKSFSSVHPKGSFFNSYKLDPDRSSPTVTATGGAALTHWEYPEKISDKHIIRLQSFPDDYQFNKQDPKYFCGMSVPPFMTQRVADQIYRQLL